MVFTPPLIINKNYSSEMHWWITFIKIVDIIILTTIKDYLFHRELFSH